MPLSWHTAFRRPARLCLEQRAGVSAYTVLYIGACGYISLHTTLFQQRPTSSTTYTSTLGCFSRRNCSKFERHQTNMRKQNSIERLPSLADSYSPLQATTVHKIESRAVASSAPGSTRRQPETTHELFSCTRCCLPAAQESPQITECLQYSIFARMILLTVYGGYVQHPWKNGFHQKCVGLFAGILNYIISWSNRKSAGRKVTTPWRVLSYCVE